MTDDPTAMSPSSGDLGPAPTEEPTIVTGDGDATRANEEPTTTGPTVLTGDNNATHATGPTTGPTILTGNTNTTHANDPTVFTGDDDVTRANDDPTTTGPTVFTGDNNATHTPGPTTGPTVFTGDTNTTHANDPTVFTGDDDVTRANDDPTTTGPTVGLWPLDQVALPGELVWQPDSPPVAPPPGRRPAYYVGLGAAVILVVASLAFAAVVTVMRPTRAVAGSAAAAAGSPAPSSSAPPPASSTAAPPADPFAEVAAHPLSSDTTRMPDATCALPRFDPADAGQAAFFQAATVCAEDAWRPVLDAAGLDADVRLVTAIGPESTPCGDVGPASPPTACEGSVYMTPAYLRDTEKLGRYPGKYLGVFLREYARAVQFSTGLEKLAQDVPDQPAADVDTRLDQQATCLAGVVSGALAGRGAVDDNITGEIRSRLTTVDAPPDAEALLDKGFQQRTPAACNVWAR